MASIAPLCVNTLPVKPECPDHLDYTIQFPVPKSEVNTLRRFMDKVERLYGVKVVITSVIPGLYNEEAQQLIQVSSKHRNRSEAERAETYCENLCKGRFQESVSCPTRFYDQLRKEAEKIEQETLYVIVFTKDHEILVQGAEQEMVAKVKAMVEKLVQDARKH